MGDSSTDESERQASRLPDEDVLSLHDEARTGKLEFEARPSWSGAVIDDQSDDPLVGTTLHDTYFVSRVIGEGGMGRVYEARHTRISSKRYAIKVLHAEFARSAEIRSRFQHEAEAAAKIGHPGVVGTYDVGETPGGGPYMVCEYLEGEDLHEFLLDRGSLPAETVIHIGQQLCSALGEAHASGVIHRDLKPHNVFVLGDSDDFDKEPAKKREPELPTVKVLDFGLSRFVERDNDLTKTGIILGTPGYMAPEQAAGLETDHRTDIYGIGAILYAIATGRPPFKEDSPQKTVLSVLSQAPTRPRKLVSSIPIGLEIVIQRAMAREPAERYQSAEEVGRALLSLEGKMGRGAFRPGPEGAGGHAPRLRLLLLLLALGTMSLPACGLALAALFELRGIEYRSFQPTVLEYLLLSILALASIFPLVMIFRHLRNGVWKDSARVADLVSRIRGPLVAGTLAYGVGALVAFVTWGARGLRAGELARGFDDAGLSFFVVLPFVAMLAAAAEALRHRATGSKKSILGFLRTVGFPVGAIAAAIVLLGSAVGASWSQELAVESPLSVKAEEVASDKGVPVRKEAATVHQKASGRSASSPEESEGKLASRGSGEVERAGPGAVAKAKSDGPEALEKLLAEYPGDGNILKALVLLHASRADTLDRSVKSIDRLFEVEPRFKEDQEVLFILKKGLLAQGEAYKAAFSVVHERMGEEAGELVFQLLNENPKRASRLKNVFFELRKNGQVTSATAIAFDLRYATSCQGRLALLERAEKDGDMRSVHQLQSLSTAPKKCGWGRKCKPLCPAEAGRFRESIKTMRARLDSPTKP